MSQTKQTSSARIREQLDHPVIDGDGHVVELVALFADFVRDHGHGDVVERVGSFRMPDYWRAKREAPDDERRRRGMFAGVWTVAPDTEYRATVSVPSRYHERIGEAGIDFAVLYPTFGLHLPHLAREEDRVTLCRLYNEFMIEQYGPFADRLTVAAVVPMHDPQEAIAAMEHAAGIGAKVVAIPSYVRRPLPDDPGRGG